MNNFFTVRNHYVEQKKLKEDENLNYIKKAQSIRDRVLEVSKE